MFNVINKDGVVVAKSISPRYAANYAEALARLTGEKHEVQDFDFDWVEEQVQEIICGYSGT